jgi:HSP20 family protein
MYAPSFDIRETDDAYHLTGDLPGVQSKDLDIEFEDSHCLNIKGHTERDSTSSEGSWRVSERSIGDFRRVFNFPSAIKQEETRANLKDGVLSMTVPKSGSTPGTKKVTVDT